MMKKLVKGALFLALGGVIMVGCEKENGEMIGEDSRTVSKEQKRQLYVKSNWSFSISEETDDYINSIYESSNYKLNYIGDFSSQDEIETTFIITEKGTGSIILNIDFTENVNQSNYKLYTRNELVLEANNLLGSNTISSNDFSYLSNVIDEFVQELKNKSDENYFYNYKYKGFNFPYSIMKMMNRAIQSSSTSCDCNTPGVYFEENAAFVCTQDILLKSEAVESFYYNLDTVTFKDSIIGVDPILLDTLSSLTSNYITYEELSQIVASLPNGSNGTDPTSGAIFAYCGLLGTQGSDIGCCGNYSGPCWYCHITCAVHDLMCWCCNSNIVGCGSGCVTEDGC
jgi:hypothetical protein